MNKTHNSQKSSITACLGALLSLSAHFMALPVRSFSPEAETVLEALREGMATGLVGESQYLAFLSGLEEEDGCEVWVQTAPNITEEIWREMLEVCPDLNRPSTKTSAPASRWSVMQAMQPRMANTPMPRLHGETRTPYGGFTLSLRDLSLYDRRAEVNRKGLKLQAGHIHSALSSTRLDFVAGSPFYAGWSGQSGISGLLASPKSTLDGLSLSYQGVTWQAQAAGAWNRLKKQDATTAAPGLDRKDALLYLFGVAGKNLVLQMVHQRFEPVLGPAASVSICGGSVTHPQGLWRIGLAGSAWGVFDQDRASQKVKLGGYGEVEIGRLEQAQLKISQASQDWSNPLQSPRGYRQDTLEGQLFLPGRGEGRLHARSLVPIYAVGLYQLEIKAGSDVAWELGSTGLLAAESRLAVVQSLGNWSYACGTGTVFRRRVLFGASPSEEETGGGLGHIVLWHNSIWKARLSLVQRKSGYQGPFRQPLTVSLERGNAHQHIRKIRAEIFAGDIKDPTSYLRLGLKQEWKMGRGLILKQALRLPWSKEEGWKNDLGYQLGLEAKL